MSDRAQDIVFERRGKVDGRLPKPYNACPFRTMLYSWSKALEVPARILERFIECGAEMRNQA